MREDGASPTLSSSLKCSSTGDPVRNDLLLRAAAISCCRNCLSQLRNIGKLHRLAIGFRFLKGMFRLFDLALKIDSTRTTSVVLACCAQRHFDSLCWASRSSSFETHAHDHALRNSSALPTSYVAHPPMSFNAYHSHASVGGRTCVLSSVKSLGDVGVHLFLLARNLSL